MLSLDTALLLLRLVIGLLFIGHGTQKLFGWFGGHGLEGTTAFFEKLDVYPPRMWAWIAALGETLGGLGLVVGLLTPLAGAAIIGVMLMAIVKVHWQHGLWVSNNGLEYALMNLVVAGVLGLTGAGAYSLDALLNLNYPMPLMFVAGVVAAIVGVLVALVSNNFVEEPEAETQS